MLTGPSLLDALIVSALRAPNKVANKWMACQPKSCRIEQYQNLGLSVNCLGITVWACMIVLRTIKDDKSLVQLHYYYDASIWIYLAMDPRETVSANTAHILIYTVEAFGRIFSILQGCRAAVVSLHGSDVESYRRTWIQVTTEAEFISNVLLCSACSGPLFACL